MIGRATYFLFKRKLVCNEVGQLKRRLIEKVKANKAEVIILKSLTNLVEDEKLFDHWFDIYTKGSVTELPEVINIERNLETCHKRNKKLVKRLSGLSKDILERAFLIMLKTEETILL